LGYEEIVTIMLAVSIQYRNMTVKWTDRIYRALAQHWCADAR